MCGIVGYIGTDQAAPIILEGLKRLEYRGYDSAGLATIYEGKIEQRRNVGKLDGLERLLEHNPAIGTRGIGHTRWATHGAPNVENTHPIATDRVAVVHNGIIENYRELRSELTDLGYEFHSETDTEVITALAHTALEEGLPPIEAARAATNRIEGAYAVVFLFEGDETPLVIARKGSPLAIGYGVSAMYVGSDAMALAPQTDTIAYLEEGDWAVVTRNGATISDQYGSVVERPPQKLIQAEDSDAEGVSASEKSEEASISPKEIKSSITSNSTAIYLTSVSVLEQLSSFIERVRGSNSLDPDIKTEYLNFLIEFQSNLGRIVEITPTASTNLSGEEADAAVRYFGEYWDHLKKNVEKFVSPENTAGLTLPMTTVALGATVGTLAGQPLVGTFIGAWLAGKLSPEKVVGKVIESSAAEQEAQAEEQQSQ